MAITFGLLALSICAVWIPPIPLGKRFDVPAWQLLFVAAIASGLAAGYLTWPALPALAFLGIVAYLAERTAASRVQRIVFGALTAVTALALALHRLPGFANPVLIADAKFSPDAAPFTQYANFDKAAAGLIILAWLCKRATTAEAWKVVWRRTWPVVAATTAIVIVAAVIMGYTRFDPKLPTYAPTFLAINLLFTCVAEEAFFRGFLQERLATTLNGLRFGGFIAIASSGLLFGVVHAAGGVSYVMFATLAGFGYAYAYACVRRVEAPIITHFVVNAVQFVGFTYPQVG
jgi:membrane protease YdiL (CAAX protease family)